MPPVGYRVYRLTGGSDSTAGITTGPGFPENRFFRVEFDAGTGLLTRILDKESRREVLAPGGKGNLLQVFKDTPRDWDAWNIDSDFEKIKTDLTDAEKVEIVESGPVRTVLRVTRKHEGSTFVQDTVLYDKIRRIDFPTRVSWHAEHKLLKVAFPVNVDADRATYEIPYATVSRSVKPKTDAEKAKFEVPAQKWADLSARDFGVSLLNDCKYGYDIRGNLMRLSLLRAPKWPDPEADQGDHSFTYSLYPHAGDWRKGGTVRAGYDLNQPLLSLVLTQSAKGELPPEHSFFSASSPNVVLGAMKKAEDSDGLIIRLYEATGSKANATITLPAKAKSACETDLLENSIKDVPAEGNRLKLSFGAYEIKTVKVAF